jgi:hypothetical protein
MLASVAGTHLSRCRAVEIKVVQMYAATWVVRMDSHHAVFW